MHGRKRRIQRLETLRGGPSPRCPVCADWPAHRLVDPAGGDVPATPERCGACGWMPLTLVVEYPDLSGSEDQA